MLLRRVDSRLNSRIGPGNFVLPGLPVFTRAGTALDPVSLQSAGANVQRFPFLGTNRGFVVEGSDTNRILWSRQFDNAAWTKTGASISADAGTAPDGTSTADKLVEDGTTAPHFVVQAAVLGAGTPGTFAVYAKAAGRTRIFLTFDTVTTAYALFDLVTGTVVSTTGCTATILPAANGYFRCSISGTAVATGNAAVYLANVAASNYAGDGASGVLLSEAFGNASAFATSPITTVGATAARVAESMTVPLAGMWNKGSWAAIFEVTSLIDQNIAGRFAYLFSLTLSAGNSYVIYWGGTGIPQLGVLSGAVELDVANAGDPVMKAGQTYRIGIRGNGKTMALWCNGRKSSAGDVVYTEPVGNLPASFVLGANSGGLNPANLVFSKVAVFQSAPSDVTMAAYTSSPDRLVPAGPLNVLYVPQGAAVTTKGRGLGLHGMKADGFLGFRSARRKGR